MSRRVKGLAMSDGESCDAKNYSKLRKLAVQTHMRRPSSAAKHRPQQNARHGNAKPRQFRTIQLHITNPRRFSKKRKFFSVSMRTFQ